MASENTEIGQPYVESVWKWKVLTFRRVRFISCVTQFLGGPWVK